MTCGMGIFFIDFFPAVQLPQLLFLLQNHQVQQNLFMVLLPLLLLVLYCHGFSVICVWNIQDVL